MLLRGGRGGRQILARSRRWRRSRFCATSLERCTAARRHRHMPCTSSRGARARHRSRRAPPAPLALPARRVLARAEHCAPDRARAGPRDDGAKMRCASAAARARSDPRRGRRAGPSAGRRARRRHALALASASRTRTEDSAGGPPRHRMLAGSVGKTFFAALALQLVHGTARSSTRRSKRLAERAWFERLPNAARHHGAHADEPHERSRALRVRPARDLENDPPRVEARDRLPPRPRPFAAGKGWEYSDTNYLVLGMLLRSRAKVYDEIQRRFMSRSRSRTSPTRSSAWCKATGARAVRRFDAMLARASWSSTRSSSGPAAATLPRRDLARWAKARIPARRRDGARRCSAARRTAVRDRRESLARSPGATAPPLTRCRSDHALDRALRTRGRSSSGCA